MANAYSPEMIKSKLGWSNSFNPNAAFPLDFRAYFGSLEDAQAAANTAVDFGSTDSAYYFGMQLYVFDGTSAKTYLIQGDKSLLEVGAASDPMIFVDDQTAMLALTDIKAGQQVYRQDTHTVWIYKGTDPSSISNWVESAAQNDTVWEGTTDKVTFEAITQATYDAATKSSNKLYFITDTGRIYKGEADVTKSITTVSGGAFPAVGTAIQGRLYIDTDSLETRVTMNGTTWMTLMPGYITDGANWAATANDSMLATKGVIKGAIQAAVDAVQLTLAYEEALGKIKVGEQEAVLTNVAHDATYDSTGHVLTIKMFGKDDVVVDIGKDKFVKGGAYYENYPETNPTHHKVIVLEVENGDPIIIPAEALVNVYTADNTDKDVVVTVSDENKISAVVKIDPIAGNALVTGAAGLKVDLTEVNDAIAGKIEKVANSVENDFVTFGADGSLQDSGYSIQLEGALESGTKIPTAALVATSITSAVQSAQGTLQAAIDDLKKTVEGHTTSITSLQEAIANIASNLLEDGAEDQIITSTAKGIKRSGKTIGTAMSETPSNDVVATEKMVADAMSWGALV